MVVDISDIVILHSYVEDCISEYDGLKQYSVSKHFRFLHEELENIIQKDAMEHFPKD